METRLKELERRTVFCVFRWRERTMGPILILCQRLLLWGLMFSCMLFIPGLCLCKIPTLNFWNQPRLYLDGWVGQAASNHRFFIEEQQAPSASLHFGGGGALGLQFNPYVGLEVGAMTLPRIYYSLAPMLPVFILNQNYFIDTAIKAILPVTSRLNLFGKLGVATSKQTLKMMVPVTGEVITLPSHQGVHALLSIGMSYTFAPRLQFSVQGFLLPGKQNRVDFSDLEKHADSLVPLETKFVGVGLSYQFNL